MKVKINKKGEFEDLQCYYCAETLDYRTCGIMPPIKRGEFGRITCSSPLCISEYIRDFEESNPTKGGSPKSIKGTWKI